MDALTRTSLLYGALLDWALLGVLCTQFYVYVRWDLKQTKKSWSALAITSGMVLTTMADTAFNTYIVHRVFLVTLHTPRAFFRERAIPVGLIAGTVQIYFARRYCFPTIHRRSFLNFTFVAATVILVFLQIAAVLIFGITSDVAVESVTNAVWNIAAILGDAAISVSVDYSQWDWSTKGKRTVMFYRIARNVLVIALLCACHFVGAAIRTVFATGNLYSNILLADLNRRRNTGRSYLTLDEQRILSISTIPTMRIVAHSEARMSTYPDSVRDEHVASIEEGRVCTTEPMGRPDDQASVSDNASFGPPPTYRS